MKKLVMILFVLFVGTGSTLAQSGRDTTQATTRQQRQTGQKFIDRDGDGIDDRQAARRKGLRRGKDRFIDANGDGICDGRESGLTFRRGGTGYMGGSSAGKGKHLGGKQ